jgi:hypothetical protein
MYLKKLENFSGSNSSGGVDEGEEKTCLVAFGSCGFGDRKTIVAAAVCGEIF